MEHIDLVHCPDRIRVFLRESICDAGIARLVEQLNHNTKKAKTDLSQNFNK
ncbi:MAG: hypothetical protein M1332_04155 [Deltaproteobacteria bacterium]|nr:hypothetical protein [Deltaproteobacteria bacterium]